MKLAVMAGDGIGPEVMNEALKVLNTLSSLDSGFQLEMEELPWSSAYYMETGRMMPEGALDYLRHFDAILFGAIGDARVPDEVTIWDLIMPIRKQFQQYVNVRPVKQLKGVASPLDTKAPIDFCRLPRECGRRIFPHGRPDVRSDGSGDGGTDDGHDKGGDSEAERLWFCLREKAWKEDRNKCHEIQCHHSYDEALGRCCPRSWTGVPGYSAVLCLY